MEGKYVFISYSSKDTEQATWVKNTLENNGIQCWMANKSIHGGKAFFKEISGAISECSALVVVLTENSQKSEWVGDEIVEARNERKRILPFVLDDAPIDKSFGILFNTIQMYNAATDPQKEIENLIRDIREEFNAPAEKVKIRKKMPKLKNKDEKGKMKLWKKLAIALLILCVLLGGIQSISGVLSTDIADNDTSLSQSLYDTTKETENNNSNWFVDKEEETAAPYEELLNNLSFELDGVTYSLPCNVSELCKNGWVCEIQDENELNTSFRVELKKGNSSIWIETYSPFQYEYTKLIDHKVGRIEYNPDCNVDFAVGGIKPGASKDEIVATFGEPSVEVDYSLKTELRYYLDNSHHPHIYFYCYPDTNRCFEIVLQKYIYEQKF